MTRRRGAPDTGRRCRECRIRRQPMHRGVTDPGLTLPAILPTHGASERRFAPPPGASSRRAAGNSAPVSGVPSRVPPSPNPAVALPTPKAPARGPAHAGLRTARRVGPGAQRAACSRFHLERGDWRVDDGSALSALAALMLVNFAAAVLIRQQNVLNVLFGLAGRGSRALAAVAALERLEGPPRRRHPRRRGAGRHGLAVRVRRRRARPRARRSASVTPTTLASRAASSRSRCSSWPARRRRCAAARTTCSS